MRRTALALLSSLVALATVVPAGQSQAEPAPQPARPADLIVITEQASRRILVLPADQEAWSTREFAWAWAPGTGNGLGDLAAAWVSPDEAKLTERGGQQYLMTTASGGFVGVVPYPQGTNAYWAADVGAPSNPHSIELLPDGNVAVAASTGGWLRVYTASQGTRSTTYAEYPLVGGHGAVWDDRRQVLWALGTHELVALRIGGTPDAPTISPDRVIPLPSEGGHDLQPVPGAPDQLWVTTETEVLRFSKSDETFSRRYPGASAINRHDVKSVTTHPRTGRVLTATPQDDHVCTWCTDTVDLALPTGELTLRGAWIYKARWWEPTATG